MKMIRSKGCIVVLISLILLVPILTEAQKPNLYGKVFIKTSSTLTPLQNATIKVISASNETVIKETYTDSRGLFALYSVPDGSYRIRVFLGTKTLNLKVGNTTATEVTVQVSGSKNKVPDIIVVE